LARSAYPDVPLFRYEYTQLSQDRITAALAPAAVSGPQAKSPVDPSLAGTSLQIVTDGGPELSYRFNSAGQLSVSESGGAAQDAGYGALRLGRIVFFAHLLPGSARGFAVYVDQGTGLSTVVELWFGDQKARREPSRAVWYGYGRQAGQPAPEKRHVATNRVEGKALYWKQDAGFETLEYFASAAYSHFVELTRLDGKRGYSAPSDYIEIDEAHYIYTRTEAEFSGIFTTYVMDLNAVEQVGLRIGFNGVDELEYYLFRGTGEWLGQIAKFEEFGDTSPPPIPAPDSSKGSRRVYRPLETMPRMTPAEVNKAVAEHTKVFAGPSVMAGNGHPPTAALAGKSATLRYDGGPVVEYRFDAAEQLTYRLDGGGWTSARYNAWEPVPGVFMFGHLLPGTKDHEGHIVVADFASGMVTCFNGYLNTPYFANEAGARTWFGRIEAAGVPDPGDARHDYTDEMLGRCITWNYSPGLTSMHLYSTPYTTSWIIFTPTGHGGMQWSGSGAHVKIRDGLYYIYWLEEACNGTLGAILVNMRTMHDTGIGYHCGNDGLSMSPVGALARHAGRFDVGRFFARRNKGDVA
jgi:hypothetical protein